MLDLYNKKYDREELKKNIYCVKLIDIIKTQKIDTSFAVKYILNTKYQFLNEDIITPSMILKYQPHIKSEQLKKSMLNYNSDEDSIEDFETVSLSK